MVNCNVFAYFRGPPSGKWNNFCKIIEKKLLKKFAENRKISIFALSNNNTNTKMKSTELHQLVRRNGWELVRAEGSHYIYEKEGVRYPVPFHGSKEVGKGLEKKIKKDMGLK